MHIRASLILDCFHCWFKKKRLFYYSRFCRSLLAAVHEKLHVIKLKQGMQCVVCVLSFEGKPALCVQLVCLHTWVGERPRCGARDWRGEGMDGGIKVDVIRESWSACQQWLALTCTDTSTLTLGNSSTYRSALLREVQKLCDWTAHSHCSTSLF